MTGLSNTAANLRRQISEADPLVMGVLNITPDSFSDGGRFDHVDQVLYAAEQMIADGADILDIGGESTRPGSTGITVETELERVLPVIEALSARFDCPLSIDTSNADTIRAACAEGVALINDVRALKRPGALESAIASAALICLMHMRGEPATMSRLTDYDDVTLDVRRYLSERAVEVINAGADAEQLLIDPGFGFAKTTTQNLSMLSRLHRIADLGYPVLVGMSRKRMIGEITGRPVDQRVHGSAAAALLAVQQGASVVRVHDVAATKDALMMWNAVRAQNTRGHGP